MKSKPAFIKDLSILLIILSLFVNKIQTNENTFLKNINTLNLLQPTIQDSNDQRAIKYKLQAFNGCYKWRSSNPTVIQIEQIPNEDDKNCSDIAYVSGVNNKSYPGVIWITATDIETGDVLKCEARVAVINRIEILTKLRTIDVGNFEELEILAYDSEGNSFSTLQGMKFEWSIDQKDSLSDFVSYKESSRKASETRESLEMSHFQSDMIVLKGQKTGSVIVNSRQNEKGYQVKTSVKIFIIEHFVLNPENEIYTQPFSQLQFDLYTFRTENYRTHHRNIPLPSDNYLWSIVDETPGKNLAKVNNSGFLDCGKNLGSLAVSVTDSRGNDNKVETSVHIVEPFAIDAQIRECKPPLENCFETKNPSFLMKEVEEAFDNKWNLIIGRTYHLRANLNDSRMNKLFITGNSKFEWVLPKGVELVHQKNHEIVIKTHEIGINKEITVSLKETTKLNKEVYKPTRTVMAKKLFAIISQLVIIKPGDSLHIPLSGQESIDNSQVSSKSQQSLKLWGLGGSGLYEWFVEDKKIAVVSQEGVVLPKESGSTKIVVRDRKNGKNFDTISLKVSSVSQTMFVEKKKELLADTTSSALLYSLNDNKERFTNCTFLEYKYNVRGNTDFKAEQNNIQYENLLDQIKNYVEISPEFKNRVTMNGQIDYSNLLKKHNGYKNYIEDKEISLEKLKFIIGQYENYGICGGVNLMGQSRGDSTISAEVKETEALIRMDSRSSVTPSSVSSTFEELQIKVFDRYSTIGPELDKKYFTSEELILSFGASLQWTLNGGPTSWDDDKRSQIKKFEVFENGDSHAMAIDKANVQAMHLASLSNDLKNVFQLTCKFPQDQKRDYVYNLKQTTWNQKDEFLIFPLKLSHSVKIGCKIPKSLNLLLLKEGDGMLTTKKFKGYRTDILTLRNQRKHTFQIWAYDSLKQPFYNFNSLCINWVLESDEHGQLKDTHGHAHARELTLNDKIGSMTLIADSFNYLDDHAHGKDFEKVHDSISQNILNNLELVPNYKLVYLHPKNTVDIKIKEGSGKFKVSVSDDKIASFDYKQLDRLIILKPLMQGSQIVNAEDSLLKSSQSASSDIIIMPAAKLILELQENLLQEGFFTTAIVNVYDENDNQFGEDQFKQMGLVLGIDSDTHDTGQEKLEIVGQAGSLNTFKVKGIIVGNYKLVARVISSPERGSITSNSVDLDVFPKLQVFPNPVMLAPGCKTSIKLIGGPSEKSRRLYGLRQNHSLNKDSVVKIEHIEGDYFTVESFAVGKTNVVFSYKRSGEKIADVMLNARIAMIDSFDIQGKLFLAKKQV